MLLLCCWTVLELTIKLQWLLTNLEKDNFVNVKVTSTQHYIFLSEFIVALQIPCHYQNNIYFLLKKKLREKCFQQFSFNVNDKSITSINIEISI